MRLQRLVERQDDLAGALIDGRAGKPTEHRYFLRTSQTNPLHLGVGDVLNVLLDLTIHRAVVGVHAAEFQKLIDGHFVPGQLGVRGLDHRKNVQHQLLLAQRKAVHCVLNQVIGFADDGLAAAAAVGGHRRLRLAVFAGFIALGRRTGLGGLFFGVTVLGRCLWRRLGSCLRCHKHNLNFAHEKITFPGGAVCPRCPRKCVLNNNTILKFLMTPVLYMEVSQNSTQDSLCVS